MKRVMDVIHNALFGVVRDRRGGVATFLAAMIIPIVAFTGLAVDTARGYLMKSRLSYALDAAALAGGREMANPTDRDAAIAALFKANFPDGYMGATIDGPHIIADPILKTIQLDATASMGTSLMRVVGVDTMSVASSTEVKLSSRNIEVAVVLDITGSMVNPNPQKLADLKVAATDLVNIVVQDSQEPHYSKVALVPYSMGVNVGAYADQIRGAVAPAVNITGITKANPAVVTTAIPHGFANGNKVFIAGVTGMTQVNNDRDGAPNIQYTVAGATSTTFQLKNSSGGSNINSSTWSTYTGPSGSVGKVCTTPGCQYFNFTNNSGGGSARVQRVSTCATERTGAEAYTDAPPSTSPVQINYPNYPNSSPIPNDEDLYHYCPISQIVPLSIDKAMLAAEINAFEGIGSTAGQIGVAWGWYMLSPKWGYLWPEASAPGDYDDGEPLGEGEEPILKVAVIMTDGDFNTVYRHGVIAKDSGSGSGGNTYKINQNSTNGIDSFEQAKLLCAGMKAEKIEIYTIGFDVGNLAAAQEFLSECATDASHAYLAADGDELKTVFKTIAMNISRLRLSK